MIMVDYGHIFALNVMCQQHYKGTALYVEQSCVIQLILKEYKNSRFFKEDGYRFWGLLWKV